MTETSTRTLLTMDSELYLNSRKNCFALPRRGCVICAVCGHEVKRTDIWRHYNTKSCRRCRSGSYKARFERASARSTIVQVPLIILLTLVQRVKTQGSIFAVDLISPFLQLRRVVLDDWQRLKYINPASLATCNTWSKRTCDTWWRSSDRWGTCDVRWRTCDERWRTWDERWRTSDQWRTSDERWRTSDRCWRTNGWWWGTRDRGAWW